jgi:hypothetical protein
MFIGHFGVAFAAKRYSPRSSLGTTFVAAQLADLLWPILLLAGVEQVRIVPTANNPFLALDFVSYPWTHSLLAECVLGAIFAAVVYTAHRDRRSALVVGLLVPSHWLLDLVVHVPDLPLYPGGSARLGLGLWRNPAATIVIECIVFFAGVYVYARSTRARDRIGRYGFWLLVLFLLGLYYASAAGPLPPSVKALAVTALVGWPLTVWPWWIDRHRTIETSALPR